MNDEISRIFDDEGLEPGSVKRSPEEARFDRMALLQDRIKRGGKAFIAVALLSILHSLLVLVKVKFLTVFALGFTFVITWLITWLGRFLGPQAVLVGLIANIVIALLLATYGYFIGKKKVWATKLALLLYLMDTVIVVIYTIFFHLNIAALIIHGIVLLAGFISLKSIREFQKLDLEEKMQFEKAKQMDDQIQEETGVKMGIGMDEQ